MIDREAAEKAKSASQFEPNIPEEEDESKDNLDSDTETEEQEPAALNQRSKSEAERCAELKAVAEDLCRDIRKDAIGLNEKQIVEKASEVSTKSNKPITDEQRRIQTIKDQAAARRTAREGLATSSLTTNKTQIIEESILKTHLSNPNPSTNTARAVTASDLFGDDGATAYEDNNSDSDSTVAEEEDDNSDNEVEMEPPSDPNWVQPADNKNNNRQVPKVVSAAERRAKRGALLRRAKPATRRDRDAGNNKKLPNGMTMDQMQQHIMERQLEEQMMAEMKLAGPPPKITNPNNPSSGLTGEEKEEPVHIETKMHTAQA
jgi:hypothetical protein